MWKYRLACAQHPTSVKPRRVLEKGVIAAKGVRLQISAISIQELLRPGALACRGVIIHDHRMIFVTVIRPDAPGTSERKFYVQHLHAGIVSLLNYDAYKQLKNHIAKHMVALIQNWFFAARHNSSLAIKKRYSELAQLLSIKLYSQRSRIISSIGPSLDELMKFNLLASWSLEKTSSGKDWKIIMTPGQALIARRRQAIQSGEMNDPRFEELVDALGKRGVRDDFGRRLLLDIPEDQPVLDQIEWADAQIAASPSTFKNPPGFYISVIRKNVAVPSNFETSSRRELRRQQQDTTSLTGDHEDLKHRELEMKYDEYRESTARNAYHALSESERRKHKRTVQKELERDCPGVAWNELKVEDFIIRQFMDQVELSFEDFCRERQISLF